MSGAAAVADEVPATRGPAPPPRPAVLAYPTPTSVHLLVLVLAVLAGGLFVGAWTYNIVAGGRWARGVAACFEGLPADPLEAQSVFEDCTAALERERAWSAAGGALVTLALAVILLLVHPAVVARRRGLRPLPAGLAATQGRVAELAAEAGVRRVPTVVVGRLSQVDAFSYGTPGRYRIALPPKLAVSVGHAALFDPVVRHELAHVRHRDVALAWFARAAWWAFWPVVLVPAAVSVVRGDLGVLGPYAWRAALVLLVVRLVADAMLRSREHDADLAAASPSVPGAGAASPGATDDGAGTGRDRLGDLRAVLVALPAARVRRGWRGLTAQHPTPAERVAVLDAPARLARSSWLDVLTVSFLAAASFPTVEAVAVAALTGTGQVDVARTVAAVVVGAPLGVVLALGQWRAALFGRLGGPGARVGVPALMVGTGLALGAAVDPQRLGGQPLGALDAETALLSLLLGAGALVVLTGLGELWADAAVRVRRATGHWLVAASCGVLVLVGATWGLALATFAVEQVDWPFALSALTASGAVALTAPCAALALAALAALVLRRGTSAPRVHGGQGVRGGQGVDGGQGGQGVHGVRGAPGWALERGERHHVPWPAGGPPGARAGLLVAAVASVAAVLVVVIAQAASSGDAPVERAQAYGLVASVAGGAALVALAAGGGARGAGLGLVVAPGAALLAAGGLVLVAPDLLGGGNAARLVRDAAPFAVVLGIAGAGLGAVPLPRGSRRTVALVTAVCAAVLCVGGATLVVEGRSRLFGEGLGLGALDPAAPDPAAPSSPDDAAERAYVQAAVPTVVAAFLALDQAVLAIDADTTLAPDARAARVRADTLPAVRAVQDAVAGAATGTARLDELHAHARTAGEQLGVGLRQYADALDAGDAVALQAAVGVIQAAVAERDEWVRQVTALQGELATP